MSKRSSQYTEKGNTSWTKREETILVEFFEERLKVGMKLQEVIKMAAETFKRTESAVYTRYRTLVPKNMQPVPDIPTFDPQLFVNFDGALDFIKESFLNKQKEADELQIKLNELDELREKVDILTDELQTVKNQSTEWESLAMESDNRVKELDERNQELERDLADMSAGLRIAQKYSDSKKKNAFQIG